MSDKPKTRQQLLSEACYAIAENFCPPKKRSKAADAIYGLVRRELERAHEGAPDER